MPEHVDADPAGPDRDTADGGGRDAGRVAAPGRGWRRAVIPLLGILLLGVIVAGVAMAPPAPADRAEALAARLRCPVCQSVSVAESRSDTALAMQERIDELVTDGASDAEVIVYFTDRYGDWVLLDPPATGFGLILWLLPAVALVSGGIIATRRRRRHAAMDVSPEWRHHVQEEVDRLRARDGAAAPW